MKGLLAGALLLAHVLAAAQDGELDGGSVWTPGPTVTESLRAACGPQAGPQAHACLLASMERSGASPQALAASRRLEGAGYISRFEERGRVDVARVRRPLSSDVGERIYLVNGDPALIDVANRALLDPLRSSPRLARLRDTRPEADLQAGSPGAPGIKPLPDGGQRFVFAFPVRACPACPDLATGFVAYDFDAGGNFRGARLLNLSLPALFQVSGAVARGESFESPLADGLVFRLEPFPGGWSISIKDKAGDDYCAPVTPPFHGPNDLVIHGWHFRGGKAPGALRNFRCVRTAQERVQAAAALGKVLWGDGASAADVEEARRLHESLISNARAGRLTISGARLGGPPEEKNPWIESMRFKLEVFPARGEAAPASP